MMRARPRSWAGRAAFATIALLAGCSTAVQPPSTSSLAVWDMVGPGESVALVRILPAADGPAVTARVWHLDRVEIDNLNLDPVAAGWRALWRAPGRNFLRLQASPEATPQDFTFIVPGSPAALDLGTFRQDCLNATDCRLVPVTDVDPDLQQQAVPPRYRERFPIVRMPARPYPPRLADTRLPPPVTPAIRVDPALWIAAVDWADILRDTPEVPLPPAGRFNIDTHGYDNLGISLMLLPVILPIALAVRAAEESRERERINRDLAAQQEAEALRLRAEQVRAAWSPCEATVAAALAPDRVEAHLRASIPRPGRAPGAASATPWEATVTRVVLRRCTGTVDSFGVEVASRWRAPGYDAEFVRTVPAPMQDRRLRFSERPPWEVPLTPEAACRPLATWCADGGAALLDQVLQAVTGARDAIAATR